MQFFLVMNVEVWHDLFNVTLNNSKCISFTYFVSSFAHKKILKCWKQKIEISSFNDEMSKMAVDKRKTKQKKICMGQGGHSTSLLINTWSQNKCHITITYSTLFLSGSKDRQYAVYDN